jgi:hypothetical protein
MKKILILGGYGYTGKFLAKHLLEQSAATIVLAARNTDKLQSYANQLNSDFGGERVSTVFADASNAVSLQNALKDVNLFLVAAPVTQYAETVIRAALDSGTDYLDVQLSARKFTLLKNLEQDIEKAGLCFITEAGFHPGLPSAMVRYAALHLDKLNSAMTACYLNMGKTLPYSDAVNELMEAFKNYQAQVFKNGRWTKPGSYQQRTIDFGNGIGLRKCYSMFFEELQDLPELYPSLTDVGFYISGSHWFVDLFITPLIIAGVKIGPRNIIPPLGKLFWWGMQTFHKPPYLVLLKIEASGEKEGRPVNITVTIEHKDGYELTAIPVVAALLQYLDGSVRKPGLWLMGHFAEPKRLFSDMEKMGVLIKTMITEEKND